MAKLAIQVDKLRYLGGAVLLKGGEKMSYRKPTYTQVDNDQTVNYITPSVIVIIAVGMIVTLTGCTAK